MINAGAGVNKKDGYERTALMFAAQNARCTDYETAVGAKADIEAKNNWDETNWTWLRNTIRMSK